MVKNPQKEVHELINNCTPENVKFLEALLALAKSGVESKVKKTEEGLKDSKVAKDMLEIIMETEGPINNETIAVLLREKDPVYYTQNRANDTALLQKVRGVWSCWRLPGKCPEGIITYVGTTETGIVSAKAEYVCKASENTIVVSKDVTNKGITPISNTQTQTIKPTPELSDEKLIELIGKVTNKRRYKSPEELGSEIYNKYYAGYETITKRYLQERCRDIVASWVDDRNPEKCPDNLKILPILKDAYQRKINHHIDTTLWAGAVVMSKNPRTP